MKSLSRVWLFVTPWTAAHQAPPSMGFSRQENWNGVPLPSPMFSLERLYSVFNVYRNCPFLVFSWLFLCVCFSIWSIASAYLFPWRNLFLPGVFCSFLLMYEEGNGTPLQCSCLENPMDGGAWWAAVHGVAKGRTWLSDFSLHSLPRCIHLFFTQIDSYSHFPLNFLLRLIIDHPLTSMS